MRVQVCDVNVLHNHIATEDVDTFAVQYSFQTLTDQCLVTRYLYQRLSCLVVGHLSRSFVDTATTILL